ncbi:hypothetical protein ACFL0A_02280 [Patescibacteria group bacterium]
MPEGARRAIEDCPEVGSVLEQIERIELFDSKFFSNWTPLELKASKIILYPNPNGF